MRRSVPVVLAMVLLLPAAGFPSRDSFPLSDYPMFSTPRPERASLAHVVVQHVDGGWDPAPPSWLGTDQVMTARALAARAVDSPDDAAALCAHVAERADDDVLWVTVRVDVYDVVGYFSNHEPIGAGREVTRCSVT